MITSHWWTLGLSSVLLVAADVCIAQDDAAPTREALRQWVKDLADEDASVRRTATEGLRAAYPYSRSTLLTGLREENERIREGCVYLLEAHPTESNLRVYWHHARNDRSALVRLAGLRAIKARAPERLTALLRDRLENEIDSANLRTILRLVSARKDKECLEVLVRRMRSTADPVLKKRGFHTLRHVTGMRFGEDLERYELWIESYRATRKDPGEGNGNRQEEES